MAKDQYIIGSDGELERYADPYADVTPEQVERAAELELEIIQRGANIDREYLAIARALAEFKNDHLYLARGFPTFRTWADSPDLKGMGYRTAHNLLRIANEAVPILVKHDALEALPPISTMVNMLPILNDEDAEEKFVKAAYEVQDKTVDNAKDVIREIRGMERTLDTVLPAIFKAQVLRGDEFHRIRIYCSTGSDYYQCGELYIKARDWHRWERRFSERFIEYEN